MSANLYRLAVLGFACAVAAPASAQLLTEKSLSAVMAMTIAQTALETCTKQGYHVSVHVLGRNGEVLVAVRGDGAPPHTMENSQRKAYTSRTFRIPSGEFVQRVKDNPTTGAVHLTGIIAAQGACRSRPATRSSARSACPERRVARRTKRTPRLASTRSPISSSEGYPQPIAVIAGPEGRPWRSFGQQPGQL